MFDEAVLDYEKRRPKYGSQIFEDIIKYADITADKSIIEIGCGTGQATESFLKTKCKVTAVELGENLAAYTKNKFRDCANLEVIQSAFENYECDNNKFDMLYSATAFHWIPDEIGYKKSYKILKSGGTIALFWNKPCINSKDDPLYKKIQSLYNQFLPQLSHKAANNTDKARYSGRMNQIERYGFIDIKFKLYHNIRKMTGVEYTELLNTYSDHRSLDKSIRLPFFNAVRAAIEESGNELIIYDTVDLYLARKP